MGAVIVLYRVFKWRYRANLAGVSFNDFYTLLALLAGAALPLQAARGSGGMAGAAGAWLGRRLVGAGFGKLVACPPHEMKELMPSLASLWGVTAAVGWAIQRETPVGQIAGRVEKINGPLRLRSC